MSLLNQMVDTLNRMAGQDVKPYAIQLDGTVKANVGTYCLQGAYGGWQLIQLVNINGGARSVSTGYVSKKDMVSFLRAFMDGIIEGDRIRRTASAPQHPAHHMSADSDPMTGAEYGTLT